MADLRLRLTEAQRKEAEARKRIDDLENRVFLMTDQIESQKVAAQTSRAPRLPIVTLRPTPEDVDGRAAAAEEGTPEPPEFSGAAQSADASRVRRPLLSGAGSSAGIEIDPSASVPPPKTKRRAKETSEVSFASHDSDSLGVAPAPQIPRARTPERASERAPERAPLDEEPLTAYRAAYAEVSAGHYDEAEQKLRAFVKRYPRHDYADNAQYWLGECFYARQKYREAASEFRTAVAKYPMGNKAPDALLKLAYSLIAAGDAAEGRRILEEVPSTYPRTEAARLATAKLGEPNSTRSEAFR